MLDLKLLRDQPEKVAEQLALRGFKLEVASLIHLEKQRKDLQIRTQELQNERNTRSKAVGLAKAKGEAIEPVLAELQQLGDNLKKSEDELDSVQKKLQLIYDTLPNLPHASVPMGKSEEDNVEIRRFSEPTHFEFSPKDHVALLQDRGLDLETAAKLSGSRFMVLKGKIARLHRALGQFMLDLHLRKHSYQEVYVPYIVLDQCLHGTGQLPKMEEDLFTLKDLDMRLIPTSEVSVTNLVREQILEAEDLPLKYVCLSPCFRKEAGSYGKDLHGMLRQHQFEKVEIVQIVKPEDSYLALEEMVGHAEAVLQLLKLPYRVMALCSADLGFAAAKTYDLEVWLPGQNRYREISSCSNTEAFQARRIHARYRTKETRKTEYVHTLNGSGVAVGRALIAVVENYQDDKGRIYIPDVLLPYMDGETVI